jgi:KipI family sensor histidine kinase inhibitor
MTAPRVVPLGDSAITIALGTERSSTLLSQVHAAARQVRNAAIHGVADVVPAYLALTVFYDPLHATFGEISESVTAILANGEHPGEGDPPRHHVIPVRYDGMDLESVAEQTSLSLDQVIEAHLGRTYTVDLLGFVPGWAYLSELDARLRIPRRAQPRPRVPAGSVAIAANQTGIYPLDTPGGWHIIGRTDAVMFDARRNHPALLHAGDTVQFERVV